MHGNDSFWAANMDITSRGRSTRSTAGRRSRGSTSIPTHVDQDISSWADVVKKRVTKTSNSADRTGDNHSQRSQGSDKSTIPSIKSHREQELETMVEKLSIENEELKQAQQTTHQSQQELLKANQELLDQLQIVKTQLTTVKEDIRHEFDMKINTIFELFRDQLDGQTMVAQTKGPRDKEKVATIGSPACKKQDNKSTPMWDRLLAMGDNRHMLEQMHNRNWLLNRFHGTTGYYQPISVPHYNYPSYATRSHESASSTGRSTGECGTTIIHLCGLTMPLAMTWLCPNNQT